MSEPTIVTAPIPDGAPTPAVLAGPIFDWNSLAQYKRFGQFNESYPSNVRRFFAPDDDVDGALMAIVKSARVSVACSMFGYDLDELDALLREAWETEGLPVQVCLDSSQAGGVHEKAILANWPPSSIGNQLVIGQSRDHAINHLKLFCIDGIFSVGGSTNLSTSAVTKQNNELIIVRDAVYAAESRAKIDLCHDEMKRQAAAKVTP